jgi:hypothetical protein
VKNPLFGWIAAAAYPWIPPYSADGGASRQPHADRAADW